MDYYLFTTNNAIKSFCYEPLTNQTFRESVERWCNQRDRLSVSERFGPISYWNTSEVRK